MHNIIFPLKDTTIYSKYPSINTGLDEILEITKEVSASNYSYRGIWSPNIYYKRFDFILGDSDEYFYAVAENINESTSSSYWVNFNPNSVTNNSRVLIKFDLSNFTTKAFQSASVVYLNLFTSIARKVPIEYSLEARPISGTWEMGTGNFTNKLSQDGSTWNKASDITEWANAGGDTYETPTASQNFNFSATDVRMDITKIFNFWSSSINEGILIKRPDSEEDNSIKYGALSFYSLDTHTVYLPTLEVAYDDHVYNTSSFYPLNASGSVSGSQISGNINVYVKNLLPAYRYNTTIRFDLTIKRAYQAKTFYEQARTAEVLYLSNGSLSYSLRDAYSNRVMVPFSDYTKVSLNSEGHFFDVSLSGFMPERFYKIIFKYIDIDGTEQYIDTNTQFKVVK